ncbi:MAG: FtsX-like permease family protein [Candidatus Bathyarchaeia archaeon]
MAPEKFRIFALTLSLILFSHFLTISLFSSTCNGTSIYYFYEQNGFDFSFVLENINISNIISHVNYLSNLPDINTPSRFTGYEGFYLAAEYIVKMLQEYGYKVSFQDFFVTVPVDLGTKIIVLNEAGNIVKVINAFSLLPNDVATCATPINGIEGRLIYAGTGELENYDDKDMDGSIVLLDFNSRYFWKYATMLGARAIIFIAPETTTRVQSQLKVLKVPLNVPRVCVSTEDGIFLKEIAGRRDMRIRVVSKVEWKNVVVQNIIANAVGEMLPHEKIILASHYDSYSSIPLIAPGASEAINVGLLLELARLFSIHRPYRTIEFVFTAGHNQALWGAREYVNEIFSEIGITARIFIYLDLSDESNYVALYARGATYRYVTQIESTRHNWISMIISKYCSEIVGKLKELGLEVNYVNAIFPSIPFYEGAPLLFDSDPFTLAGGVGITFHTTNCIRERLWTPIDRSESIMWQNVAPQIYLVAACIYRLANEISLQVGGAPTKVATDWGFASLKIIVGKYNLTKAFYDPYENPDTIIHVQWPLTSPFAGKGAVTLKMFETTFDAYIKPINNSSTIVFHGVKPYTTVTVEAYVVNRTGNIVYATDLGVYGLGRGYPTSQPLVWIKQELETFWVPLFECASIVLLNIVDPTTSTVTSFIVENYHYLSHTWNLKHFERSVESDAVAFIPPNTPTELVIIPTGAAVYGGAGAVSGAQGRMRYPLGVLANISEDSPEGVGYKLPHGEQLVIRNTPLEIAKQMLILTKQRVDIIFSYRVREMRIEDFYPLAKVNLQISLEALQKKHYGESVAYAISSWSYILSTYTAVMDLIMDVISTVSLFFIMSILFAYLLTLLVFPHISGFRKAIAFCIIFVICILVISLFHPGFHIATSVYMMILGATVGIAALLVLSKVINETLSAAEVQRERILGTHIIRHSRFESLKLSFSVGIQNMGKRKFRTMLILFSIIIISASLTTLTSASAFNIAVKSVIEGKPAYKGILVRDPNFSPQAELMEFVLRQICKEYGFVSPRTWVTEEAGFVLGKDISVRAMFGLTPEEKNLTGVDKALIEGRWLLPTDYYVVLLPKSLSERMNVTVNQKIKLLGIDLLIIGILDDDILGSLSDIDQISFSPILFKEGSITTLSPREYVIVPYKLLIENFMTTPYSFGIFFRNESAIIPFAESLSRQALRLNVYAGLSDRTIIFSAMVLFGISGLTWLLIPLFIGSLTILNMMISAVYERLKEISIYTVVGLNPTHIASLFLSESILYAVVGALSGYMISNVVTGLMDLLRLLPKNYYVNYASTFVIISMLIIVIATLLASVYPSAKASRLSVPSLRRKWEIPTSPKGDEWSIPLPFILTEEESGGALEYIKEYIDSSTGVYEKFVSMASKISVSHSVYEIVSTIRLAPYDVGLTQNVRIRAVKAGGNRMSFEIVLHRLTGHVDTWITSNKIFIDLIRKQFLNWRALSLSDKAKYINSFKMKYSKFNNHINDVEAK